MSMDFNLDIKIKLDDHSPEVIAAVKNAVDRGLASIGEEAGGYAKDIIIDAGRVDTGNMKNSIDYRVGKDLVAIGTNVEYAPYHEFGTSRGISAIHFLQRGVSEHMDRWRELLKDSLENA